jgi:type IV pilus assembly protein PilM
VAESLQRLWRENKFRSREVIVGVSSQDVLVRFASFPPIPLEKIRSMVRFQARDYLPISLDDAIMDLSIIGPAAEAKENMQEVLLVATPRTMIQNILDAVAQAGLKPRDINVVSLSLLQLLPLNINSNDGVVAFLDLANGSSNILVANAAGMPRMARCLFTGLQYAAELLHCSLPAVLQKAGAAKDSEHPAPFNEWVDSLVKDVRASISYYQGQAAAAPVERLILSGRGARLAGIVHLLEDIFGIPVSTAAPLILMNSIKGDREALEKEAVDYAVSIALAHAAAGGS